MNITGVILAGGKSSRMGQDKGFVKVNDDLMINHIIKAIKPITNNIVIIANNEEYKNLGYPVYKDIIKEKGPLAGLYTGFFNSQTNLNICLSCDIPKISSEVIKKLIEEIGSYDAAIAYYMGKSHPLIGVYKQDLLEITKEKLDKNQLKLRELIAEINTKMVDFSNWDESIFYNINSPEELKELI